MSGLSPASTRGAARADRLARVILGAIAGSSVLLLAGIFLFLLVNGIGVFTDVSVGEFLGTSWNPSAYGAPKWGMLPLLLGTVMVAAGSLAIAVPLGFLLAIYLAEVASPRMREIVKPLVEMIAGIPSVVLGLLGLLYVSPIVAWATHQTNGLNGLTASILVAIAAIPTIASVAEDALSGVSRRLREASLALGATEWTGIWRVVFPAARSGLAAATMLGLGRAIGETMIVLMVGGNSLAMPRSFLDPIRPITATIAIEVRETVAGSAHWHSLFALGLVLFVLTFALNTVGDFFFHKRVTR